ncbi:hypothetical protein OOZ19_25135 [Saccharopolyspora sp. NFXS83]|nr:hypothetical protein [Saccharopolyspora sp. NFXS83]
MLEPPDTTRFADAADRHYRDAQLLREEQRFANADHLAGVAAECALKAILVGHLGGVVRRGRPTHPQHSDSRYGHLPGLWRELGLISSGRTGSTFHQVITGTNPFLRWDVAERYSDGSHIDARRADTHLDEARKILSFHQQAQIYGALP